MSRDGGSQERVTGVRELTIGLNFNWTRDNFEIVMTVKGQRSGSPVALAGGGVSGFAAWLVDKKFLPTRDLGRALHSRSSECAVQEVGFWKKCRPGANQTSLERPVS